MRISDWSSDVCSSDLPDGLKKLRDRWRQEWEEEQGRAAAEADTMGEGSRDAILAVVARIEAIRLHFLEDIAPDPVKRAAWELLVGLADRPRVDAAAAGDAPWAETRRSMPDPAIIGPPSAPAPYAEDKAAVGHRPAEPTPH